MLLNQFKSCRQNASCRVVETIGEEDNPMVVSLAFLAR